MTATTGVIPNRAKREANTPCSGWRRCGARSTRRSPPPVAAWHLRYRPVLHVHGQHEESLACTRPVRRGPRRPVAFGSRRALGCPSRELPEEPGSTQVPMRHRPLSYQLCPAARDCRQAFERGAKPRGAVGEACWSSRRSPWVSGKRAHYRDRRTHRWEIAQIGNDRAAAQCRSERLC